MAKVLLIQANYDIDRVEEKIPWMPLALAELGTFIREKGHKIKVLDRNLHYDNDKLKEILQMFKPDIVGMTCYTSPVIKDIKQVAEIVKKNSSSWVIIGGIHATLEPKSLLEFEHIDYIVRGEGELTLLEICDLIDAKKASKKNMLKILNVNYNKMRPLIDLRELPIMDYGLLEVKKYPVATFYTSRGCPGRCKFCYNLGRNLRFYDTDKVIKMMTSTIEKYDIKEFTIADDNFANLSKRTEKICNALSSYNIAFHIFLRVDQTHDKIMKNLKKAGCWAIQFGFESGSQKVLDSIHKDTRIEQNIKAIQQCKKYKIFVDGSFMVGLPGETTKEAMKTARFIRKFKPDSVDIKIYKPYPSTELFEDVVNKGLLRKPCTLDEWIQFCDFKNGEPNVSDIPTDILIKMTNDLSKSSNKTYFKKMLLLLLDGHIKYALFKTKLILKNKLGLRKDEQRTN